MMYLGRRRRRKGRWSCRGEKESKNVLNMAAEGQKSGKVTQIDVQRAMMIRRSYDAMTKLSDRNRPMAINKEIDSYTR